MENVEVPGGQALLRTARSEMTARQRRPIEVLATMVGKKVDEVATASRLICDGRVVLDQSAEVDDEGKQRFAGGDVEVTRPELALIMELNDAIAMALLVSWTLDRPVPKTTDEYLDLPVDLYDSLRAHAARINAAMQAKGDGFSVDAVEDKASPTGG